MDHERSGDGERLPAQLAAVQFAFFMQDGFMFRQVLNLQKAYGKPCSRTIYLRDPPREKSDDVGQQMFLCNEDKDTGLH